MNWAEAKILHGVYHHREMVGEAIPYSAGELNWLINASWKEGKQWVGEDQKFNSVEVDHDNWLARHGLTSATAERPLAYLQEHGFLNYNKESGLFRIKVTGRGADTARELATWYGRMNYLYKMHKDGLLWLLATVAVSLCTTLVVQSCKTNIR